MIGTRVDNSERLHQGDIISNVEYIESVIEEDGKIKISKIQFPLVIVMTQECDLTWDYESRKGETKNEDKYLFSVIVVPLYNYEHFIAGEHLKELGQTMTPLLGKETSTPKKNLRQNETPRYHYLEFGEEIPIVNSVLDFKHYFSVNVDKLREHKQSNYVCTVADLFKERISQRFANYLSRIGLPEVVSYNNEISSNEQSVK